MQGLQDALRLHVEKYLPDYMIPQTWIVLDALPLTANSKVDTKKLRQLATSSQSRRQDSQAAENNSEVALILRLVAQVLGVPADALSAARTWRSRDYRRSSPCGLSISWLQPGTPGSPTRSCLTIRAQCSWRRIAVAAWRCEPRSTATALR